MNTTWSPTARVQVVAVILLGTVWLAVVASPLMCTLTFKTRSEEPPFRLHP